jgi:hypothetical protein
MKPRTLRAVRDSRQKGQTIALMAVAMVSLLAISALAIDLTTLYVAHGEIQRAADAAALAGAKAFVDSGVTTSPSNGALQTLAQNMASDFATAVVNQNNVAGAPASFINGAPLVNLNISLPGNANAEGNPRITVTLQRTGLPLFFARIWGGSLASVSATAIAEAYNPAYAQTNVGAFLPPAPKCVKPFLVVNGDPNQSGIPFVDKTTGAITVALRSFIAETLTLSSACGVGGACPTSIPRPGAGQYLPMPAPVHAYCPNSSAQGCSGGVGPFGMSTQCCDGTTFDYQQCGVSGTVAAWDTTTNPGALSTGGNGDAQKGLQCLIHTNGTGPPSGNPPQDTISTAQANGLMQIQPGVFSQSRYGISRETLISTSDSIITVPLFDASAWPLPNPPQVTIVGFLQLFVRDVPSSGGDMNAVILNVIGCGNTLAVGSAVSGGGVSPIPVHLIHN